MEKGELNSQINSSLQFGWRHQIYRRCDIKGRDLDFPDSSVGKESTCNDGDPGLIPELGRSTGEGIGYPLQYSWPGEFHGLYSPWGHKESDMTE